jgi:hypothetical protein
MVIRRPSAALLFFVVLIFVSGTSTASAQESTTGNVTFHGLLQVWHLGGSGFDDTFKIRRTELKFVGAPSPRVKWTLMVDPAKALSLSRGTSPRPDENPNVGIILQDAFITLNYHRRLNLDVGQFKVPLSLEGLESSADLDTERPLFNSDRRRGGAYGDVRDVGVMAYGPLVNGVAYQLGFFSGSGDAPDDLPDDDSKAIAARLLYQPRVLRGLQVGASRLWSTGPAEVRARRERLGAELRYRHGPLTLKTEYMTGTDGPFGREGRYVHFSYSLTSKWEAIVRYDTWDPDTHLETTPANVTERDYIGGFDYLISGNTVKLQFNYVRKTFENDVVGPSHIGATRLQASW